MLRKSAIAFFIAAGVMTLPPAATAAATDNATDNECKPGSLGTARSLAIDASASVKVGSISYRQKLDLKPGEVVLTFDDGPLSQPTSDVLDALKAECVKATFFIVGTMAQANPALLRRIRAEGHTIGSHSQTHPIYMKLMPPEQAKQDLDTGVATLTRMLGDDLAPFIRFPGFSRTPLLDQHVTAQNLALFSADITADDWTDISADTIMNNVLHRLKARGRGIILLHDIKPKTAAMLPRLLRALKERGYSVVHLVPEAAPAGKRAAVQNASAPRHAAY